MMLFGPGVNAIAEAKTTSAMKISRGMTIYNPLRRLSRPPVA
jgi:hypothetical protein